MVSLFIAVVPCFNISCMGLGACSIMKEMQIIYLNKFIGLIIENKKFTFSANSIQSFPFLLPLVYATLDIEVNGY